MCEISVLIFISDVVIDISKGKKIVSGLNSLLVEKSITRKLCKCTKKLRALKKKARTARRQLDGFYLLFIEYLHT